MLVNCEKMKILFEHFLIRLKLISLVRPSKKESKKPLETKVYTMCSVAWVIDFLRDNFSFLFFAGVTQKDNCQFKANTVENLFHLERKVKKMNHFVETEKIEPKCVDGGGGV